MQNPDESPGLFLRLIFPDGARFGPGKAELLDRIARTGSISAAGREMGMSYKRAWSLVEEMNALFSAPVVESTRGGAGGGGARLTETGSTILAAFHSLQAAATQAAAGPLGVIGGLTRDMSDRK